MRINPTMYFLGALIALFLVSADETDGAVVMTIDPTDM